MNETNFVHALWAVLIQAVISTLTGDWWAGATAGSFFFIGREHAQREYKIGDPSKLHGYEALDFWNWSLDAKLDMIFPVIAVVLIAFIFGNY